MRAALGENISAPRSTFFARFHLIVAQMHQNRCMQWRLKFPFIKKYNGKCGAWKFVLSHVAYRLISLIQGVLKVIAVRRTRRGSHFVIATE
jgi:hypothetical protein